MENEFVPYGIALQMKELGYNERNIYHYANGVLQEGITYNSDHRDYESISAPLYQQAFRWFREKHKLLCLPEPTGSWRYSCHYRSEDRDGKHWVGYLRGKNNNVMFFNTYEEAELECLKKLIEIVKNEKL